MLLEFFGYLGTIFLSKVFGLKAVFEEGVFVLAFIWFVLGFVKVLVFVVDVTVWHVGYRVG